MIASWLLLQAAAQYGGSLAWWMLASFYAHITLRMLAARVPWLTLASPTVPIGTLRDVQLQSHEAATLKLHHYPNAYWYILSLFIVPYEAMVMYVDAVMDPDSSKGFVLTPQERLHSAIHSAHNRVLTKVMASMYGAVAIAVSDFSQVFFVQATRFLKRFFPNVVHTIVVIVENKFYYDRSIPDLFEEFDDSNGSPVTNKIFLWHHYEELEHHMETVELTRHHFGSGILLIVPLVFPIFLALQYTVHLLALILSIACCLTQPRHLLTAAPLGVLRFLYDLVFVDLTGVLSALLIMGGVSSRDDKLAADLQQYRSMFKEKYNIDLASKQAIVF